MFKRIKLRLFLGEVFWVRWGVFSNSTNSPLKGKKPTIKELFVPLLPEWASCAGRAWQRPGSCCWGVQSYRWPALWSQTPHRSALQTAPASSQPGPGERQSVHQEMPAHSIECQDLQKEWSIKTLVITFVTIIMIIVITAINSYVPGPFLLFFFFHALPGSVMPTTSSLLSTSATTCTAVWLTTWPLIRWMEGVRRREHVRAASIRISLCSLFKKWSAQWRTNWVRECPDEGT